MQMASDMAREEPRRAKPAPQAAPHTDTPEETRDLPEIPSSDSPPTSPWWTAPGGKAVAIPSFGRSLIDFLLGLLAPWPQPRPVRVRARSRR